MQELTYIEATRQALDAEMESNPDIFVVGEGVGPRGGNYQTTVGLHEKYGDWRLRDVPISERGFTSMCIGAAAAGLRPIIDFMFLDFELDAFGEIYHQMTKLHWMSNGAVKVPVVMRGGVGIASVGPHHAANLFSVFTHIPGLHVIAPVFPDDAKGLFTTALRCDDPVLVMEHKKLMFRKSPVPEGEYTVPFGKARVVREGKDITIIGISYMVTQALEAAEQLASENISVEIIDPRTLSTLDMVTFIESLKKTNRLLIVDEDFQPSGIGAEISARITEEAFDWLDAPIHRLNGKFTPAPHSPVLEKVVVPQVEDIVHAARYLLEE
jgi:2-oxoisovalerate dehydrogenase E1 component